MCGAFALSDGGAESLFWLVWGANSGPGSCEIWRSAAAQRLYAQEAWEKGIGGTEAPAGDANTPHTSTDTTDPCTHTAHTQYTLMCTFATDFQTAMRPNIAIATAHHKGSTLG